MPFGLLCILSYCSLPFDRFVKLIIRLGEENCVAVPESANY